MYLLFALSCLYEAYASTHFPLNALKPVNITHEYELGICHFEHCIP